MKPMTGEPMMPRNGRGDVSGRATAVLALEDGSVFWGQGLGAVAEKTGEVCFNTAMTGYQEILSDPSYAGQIISFTCPHVGNVGVNDEDMEATTPAALGCVLRMAVTTPSNFRATQGLDHWLRTHSMVGISGVDTRKLTLRIRDLGAPKAVLAHHPDGVFDLEALREQARRWPGLEGMELAQGVSCTRPYRWTEPRWRWGAASRRAPTPRYRVVVVDFGVKRAILRSLVSVGCQVTVVPATAMAADILSHDPDGVLLSNGPGDPAATAAYAAPMIRELLARALPLFGVCLGHQLLALALGARTVKMGLGHHGANHPVRDLETGKVEITSQNHGFMVDLASLPASLEATHLSLFDGSLAGLRVRGKPAFSVQYHPEASPGPQDSGYLFDRFAASMTAR